MVAVGKNKHRKRPAGAANRKANGKTVLAAAARTDTDAFDPSLSLDDILEMEEQQSQSASSNSNKRMRTSKSSSSQDDSDNDNADDDAEVDADAVAVAGGKRKDPFEDAVDVEELLYGDVDFDLDSFVNIDDFKEDPSVLNPKAAQRAKAKAEAVSPSAKRLKRISDSDPVSRGYAADVVADDDGGLDADADDDDEDDAEQQEADKKADNQTNNKKPVFDFPAVPRSSPWNAFGLHASIVSNLVHHLGFPKPTDIQSQTLSQTLLHHHDVIGAAETGSGKTLAYGLPILQHIATVLPTDPDMPCAGLIIAPTRELALQVADHLRKAGRGITHKVVAVVGGMSSQKQKRQLASGPHVLVATPGRLWELMQDDDMLMDALQHVKFLVIDEADRMLEAGHFRDLDEILARISVARLPHDQAARIKRRTLVFSATMLEDASLQQILTQAKKKAAKGKKRFGNTLFGKLLDKVSFRDEHPVYINLSTKNVVAKGLLEAKIDCLKTQKDAMLYYVLTRYPGKTIVFANSIDAIRRLVPILTVLRVPAFGLHAEMQQRQRLKSLDRFRESENAVLVASDVAARGLDIPAVDHVVHYQLPRSADVYVHRSGRTARAMTEGVSVALVCPEELTMYKKVCHVLKKENGLPDFPVDMSILEHIKHRIHLAREIDLLEHRERKITADRDWFRKTADEAGILLSDDDLNLSDAPADGHRVNKKKGKKSEDDDGSDRVLSGKERSRLASLKFQLSEALGKTLMPKGVSSKYITSNVIAGQADVFLARQGTAMPAYKSSKATDDLRSKVAAHRGDKPAKPDADSDNSDQDGDAGDGSDDGDGNGQVEAKVDKAKPKTGQAARLDRIQKKQEQIKRKREAKQARKDATPRGLKRKAERDAERQAERDEEDEDDDGDGGFAYE